MAKVNVFYMIAAVCSLLLVAYAWFMFLPTYEGELEYYFVRNIIMVLTVLLLISAGIQMFLSMTKEESKSHESAEEQVKE